MNPVDELYDLLRTADYKGNVTDEDCLDRADAIIAAGWRLVPEGSVVVSREDAALAREALHAFDPNLEHGRKYIGASNRLRAAIADAIEQEAGDVTIIRAEQQEG